MAIVPGRLNRLEAGHKTSAVVEWLIAVNQREQGKPRFQNSGGWKHALAIFRIAVEVVEFAGSFPFILIVCGGISLRAYRVEPTRRLFRWSFRYHLDL